MDKMPLSKQEFNTEADFETILTYIVGKLIGKLEYKPFVHTVIFKPLDISVDLDDTLDTFTEEDLKKLQPIFNTINYETVIFPQKTLEVTISDELKEYHINRIKYPTDFLLSKHQLNPSDFILTKTNETGTTLRDILELSFRFMTFDNGCMGDYVEWIESVTVKGSNEEKVELMIDIGSGT